MFQVSFERFKLDMAKKYNIYEERISEGESKSRPGSAGLRQSASVDFPRVTARADAGRRSSLIDEETADDVVRDIVDSLVDKVAQKVKFLKIPFSAYMHPNRQGFSYLMIPLQNHLVVNRHLLKDSDSCSRPNHQDPFIGHPSTSGPTFIFGFCLTYY